jgi:dihydrolipoamide dehydrogenase
MAEATYDVVVIGGGPGGYTAANRAGQLGFKTAVIEKRGTLGGTCLNIGCIPSKALLQSSHLYAQAGHDFAAHGIKVSGLGFDLPAMMTRKDKVVDGLTKGVEFLFKKNKVDWIKGAAKLVAPGKIEVTPEKGEASIVHGRHIIIATGSEVMPLPGVEVDEKQVVSSTGALALDKVPEHLVVIGGGYIGLEMGSVWRRLGSKVTVVEFLDRIVPGMDGEIAKLMQRVLTKQGMTFKLSSKVTAAKPNKKGVALTFEPANGGKAENLDCDVVLVSIGRRPYTEGLGLGQVGVQLDNRGRIVTDEHFRTTAAGIYAIGDVIAGPMLAHKAEDEGVVLVEQLAGQKPHIDYDCIPGVVYTWPEAAVVGKTEEELKAAGRAYKAGKFPFTANARARANADTEGFVKLLADAETDRVLGCHIIGPEAGTMIAEVVAVMEMQGTAEDVLRTCHAHPTLNEAVREAALAVHGRPLNM